MSISQLSAQERLRATLAATAVRSGAAAYKAAQSPAVTRQPDVIDLSAAAKTMSAALKSVASADDVREDRIAALKTAIATGTYSVSSRDLAQAMVKGNASLSI